MYTVQYDGLKTLIKSIINLCGMTGDLREDRNMEENQADKSICVGNQWLRRSKTTWQTNVCLHLLISSSISAQSEVDGEVGDQSVGVLDHWQTD